MSNDIAFGQTTHTITLLRLGDSYRWQREDGEWVSPTFSTPEAAYYASGKLPFITDAEWKELHPLPGDPSEIREHTPNDPKLSDRGARRTTCVVCGKAEAEAGSVTCGAVRCSAWLGDGSLEVPAWGCEIAFERRAVIEDGTQQQPNLDASQCGQQQPEEDDTKS